MSGSANEPRGPAPDTAAAFGKVRPPHPSVHAPTQYVSVTNLSERQSYVDAIRLSGRTYVFGRRHNAVIVQNAKYVDDSALSAALCSLRPL